MKSAQQFWDKAAARYAKSPVKDEASYQKKLAITRDYFQPDWSVFEFGCGTGSTAILHAPYVRDILATDVSAKMLEIAEAKARDAGIDNIRFQQGTLDSLSLTPGSFDAVLGLNILHLVEDPEAAISRVSSLLKPGGVFVSSTVLAADMKLHWRLLIPLMQALGFAPHVSRFGKKGLLAMLARAGFDIDHEWQPDSLSVFIVARKRA
ncbi:MAG: class I SAM-dependent methyltransferase [Alcanivorax sp.]|jgi:ubiquinone/menaquinone biosynthesis C-methylase UbiE|uniref:class I SAM-dependent methyltransferase n=1 Tax=Alcanivorax sp. TaxID=1872427 RepID=UPI00261209A4|nr:class I SAM-dependent methyltransferase [Alcanivorax sp.]MDF1723656.1 class I SAM-dependent methyltransferase [Alcanivorax sp.]